MPAELGLALHDLPGGGVERGGLEGFDHLAPSEPSEVSAVPLGGAGGVLLGELIEAGTVPQEVEDGVRGEFILDEDV